MSKVCSSCKKEKSYSDYSKNRSRSDGYAHYCKDCANGAFKQWKDDNRDAWRKSKRQNYADNIERERERARTRRKENPEPLRRHNSTYNRNHPERMNAVNCVNRAIARGELIPVSECNCSFCGSPADEYHHESYAENDWLNVTPLCRSCHRQHHNKINRGE